MTRISTTAKKPKAFRRARPKKDQRQKCKGSIDETAVIHQGIYPIEPTVEINVRDTNIWR